MPVWVFMMLWGRRVFLLPYFADDAITYAVLSAAMYLPLLVFALTRSTIVSKGISAGRFNNTYRGLVRVLPNAENVRNFTQCDSLLLGDKCGAHTVPYIEVKNPTATIEHEATTSKISEDQLFYAMSRGLDQEAAVALIVNGFAREVLKQLPMEFAVEAQKLLGISLEGSVG
jgi:Fe-S cluster assembly protein SufB